VRDRINVVPSRDDDARAEFRRDAREHVCTRRAHAARGVKGDDDGRGRRRHGARAPVWRAATIGVVVDGGDGGGDVDGEGGVGDIDIDVNVARGALGGAGVGARGAFGDAKAGP